VTALRVAVVTRSEEPLSFRNYRERVLAALAPGALEARPVPPEGPVPEQADLLWDPGLGMGRAPRLLGRSPVPVVATLHGLRHFSLPAAELAAGALERAQVALARLRRRREWRRLAGRVARVVAVSHWGAGEIERALGIPRERIRAIHHGVAHDVYRPQGERAPHPRPYLLHVSSYQRKKNLERLVAAHARLHAVERPDLVLVVPDYAGPPLERAGVVLHRRRLAPAELARWYRGALAFAFPSLHETFGMPILEAMACGAPVLTSRATACPEVAGEAALLVDPRSTDEIERALLRLVRDGALRARLRALGLARASHFDWGRCAAEHAALFAEVAGAAR
jgi:glycosyltransferase involved in cell wall biosynthesis